MKKVVIESVYAVAMHHFGKRSLDVGEKYVLKAEPTNAFDKNATAIYKDERKVGYLKRDHAKYISNLYRAGFVKNKILLKPKFEPVIRKQKVGPEQRYNIGFLCRETTASQVLELFKSSPFVCRVPS